ncbi:hypothetical protein GCM10022415_19510 [Knoellia locipacati]|uniref:DUF304 domain-containing protein n=2 Tax=Knoellia locipacati TaxID=882824 RepID=A0A512T150_9MICO|nr:hypothetical protein KLO01_19460 [Knoellia locipacati]
MLRGSGYLTLVVVILTVFLAAGVMGFLDPAMDASSDPDWMFWVWTAANVGLLARAPFVGLLIDEDRVVRRGWVRSRTYAASDVVGVGSRGYSGLLNRGSQSRRFTMLTLKRANGPTVEVPEVTGRAATTAHSVSAARSVLGLDGR